MEQGIDENVAKPTTLLISGEPVNPWLIEADLGGDGTSDLTIELRVSVPVLLHELKEVGIVVARNELEQFVTQDLKNHPKNALGAYLTIARYVLNRPQGRNNRGWLARMLTSQSKWTAPRPEWKWIRISEITSGSDDTLTIKGKCCRAG